MDWNLNNATHSLNPRKIPLRGTFRSAWVRVWAQIMRRINGINLSKTDRRVHKLCLNGMLTSNRKLLLRSSRTTPEVNLFDKKLHHFNIHNTKWYFWDSSQRVGEGGRGGVNKMACFDADICLFFKIFMEVPKRHVVSCNNRKKANRYRKYYCGFGLIFIAFIFFGIYPVGLLTVE